MFIDLDHPWYVILVAWILHRRQQKKVTVFNPRQLIHSRTENIETLFANTQIRMNWIDTRLAKVLTRYLDTLDKQDTFYFDNRIVLQGYIPFKSDE